MAEAVAGASGTHTSATIAVLCVGYVCMCGGDFLDVDGVRGGTTPTTHVAYRCVRSPAPAYTMRTLSPDAQCKRHSSPLYPPIATMSGSTGWKLWRIGKWWDIVMGWKLWCKEAQVGIDTSKQQHPAHLALTGHASSPVLHSTCPSAVCHTVTPPVVLHHPRHSFRPYTATAR